MSVASCKSNLFGTKERLLINSNGPHIERQIREQIILNAYSSGKLGYSIALSSLNSPTLLLRQVNTPNQVQGEWLHSRHLGVAP